MARVVTYFKKSLCPLCVLCVCGGESEVRHSHHRVTENTEEAQSKLKLGHYYGADFVDNIADTVLLRPSV
jgi:hypothetical protein